MLIKKFIKKYQCIESITIKPESFSDIEWLSHFIEDEETTVIIFNRG